jgi:Uma2 family endonuclease
MGSSKTKFSLQEFLSMPESSDRSELIDGKIVAKVSPTSPHSRAQKRLLILINTWCEQINLGEVNPEWTVTLKRNDADWVSVPDLTYIVPKDWDGQGPCPGIPELVIEIISLGQSFGEAESWGERFPSPKLFKKMTGKATDYLLAGVDRVWVVDNQAQSVTVFGASEFPQIFWLNDIISDALLPELAIALTDIFAPRRLPNAE